jgi:hypothetical protein
LRAGRHDGTAEAVGGEERAAGAGAEHRHRHVGEARSGDVWDGARNWTVGFLLFIFNFRKTAKYYFRDTGFVVLLKKETPDAPMDVKIVIGRTYADRDINGKYFMKVAQKKPERVVCLFN